MNFPYGKGIGENVSIEFSPKSNSTSSKQIKNKKPAGARSGKPKQTPPKVPKGVKKVVGKMTKKVSKSFFDTVGKHMGVIMGSGDYRTSELAPRGNSLMNGTPTFPTFEGEGIVTIRRREKVTDIYSSALPFNIFSVELDPSSVTSFPWGSTIAQNFQMARYDGIVLEFVTDISLFSTSGNMPFVACGVNADPTAPSPTTRTQIEGLGGAYSSDMSKHFYFGVECADVGGVAPRKNGIFIANSGSFNASVVNSISSSSAATPAVLTSMGTYHMGYSSGTLDPGLLMGELWINYDVTFVNPISTISVFGVMFEETSCQVPTIDPADGALLSVETSSAWIGSKINSVSAGVLEDSYVTYSLATGADFPVQRIGVYLENVPPGTVFGVQVSGYSPSGHQMVTTHTEMPANSMNNNVSLTGLEGVPLLANPLVEHIWSFGNTGEASTMTDTDGSKFSVLFTGYYVVVEQVSDEGVTANITLGFPINAITAETYASAIRVVDVAVVGRNFINPDGSIIVGAAKSAAFYGSKKAVEARRLEAEELAAEMQRQCMVKSRKRTDGGAEENPDHDRVSWSDVPESIACFGNRLRRETPPGVLRWPRGSK